MKRTVIISLTLLLSQISFPQTDFREGFVLMNPSDTLSGLIDYREGTRSFKNCSFKESEEQNSIIYTPAEIYGYGFIGDKYFESKRIDGENNDTILVFIEVLVKGRVSLFKHNGTFFVQKGDSSLFKLKTTQRETVNNGKKVIVDIKSYVATLAMLLSDCEEVRSIIPKTGLSEKPLTSLVEDYNNFQNALYKTFKSGKSWFNLETNFSAGISHSKLSFKTDQDQYSYMKGPFEKANSLVFGISFGISSPRINEQISFQVDAFYFRSTYNSFSLKENSSSIVRDYVTIGITQLKVPVGFRYTLPEKKFTPYLAFGIFNTFCIKANSLWTREVEAKADHSFSTFDRDAINTVESQIGLWVSGGLMKSLNQKLTGFIELRSEFSNGISPNPVKSKINNIQICLGLKINKHV